MSQHEFTLKFRGVRGGYPMPGPTTVKYGGNTTCFEVRAGGHLIIVDAGTGIISLGREMMINHQTGNEPLRAILLFTHLHHDHTQGLPFFVPLRDPRATLYLFGAKPSDTTVLEQDLAQAIQPPFFPLGLEELYSQRQIRHIRGEDCILLESVTLPPRVIPPHERPKITIPPEAVTIDVYHGYHHPRAGVLIFRITYQEHALVIATDTEGYCGGDRRLVEFSQGADLLVHDAEYDDDEYADQPLVRQGWGHSTWRMAVDVARKAGVKQLALHHHSPGHSDAYLEMMEKKAQELFPNTVMAQEGLVISLL